MIQKITIAVVVFAVLLASVGYFSYTAWEAHTILNSKTSDITLSDVQVAENRKRLVQALTNDAGVSMSNALRGFWYKYLDENGSEQVAFFNVDKFARRDMTQWQIERISQIINKSQVSDRDSMRVVDIIDMPNKYQFHNTLYSAKKSPDFLKNKFAMEGRITGNKYSKEDLFNLSYMYELEGKYAARDELNKRSCSEFGDRCEKNLNVTVTGRVTDMDGMPVQSAIISILSAGELIEKTDEEGVYTISVPVRKMEKVRVKASKRNYSDGIANTVVVTTGKKKYVMDDIMLASPLKIVTINNKLKTITGEENLYNNGVFTIQTPQSKYSIPADSIVHKGGGAYSGEMEVYLYEFTRDTAPDSLLAVDTMDDVMGYAGDLMKSFGMPYIQFFTPEGEELHVLKSNPMDIQYKIYHMDELFNDSDKIYRALTLADMENLVFASLAKNYPIDREYLIQNDLLQFPAFWVFDRTVGVWENVGINVVTADGLIESIFYTINDSR